MHYVSVAVAFVMLSIPTVGFGLGSGVPTSPSDPGPRLRASVESFDFGYAPQLAHLSHAFWIKNIGTEVATIQRIKPNCGCTRAPLTDSIIVPGDSTSIEVILGTGKMIGEVEKYARLYTDAIGRVPALIIKSHVLADGTQPPNLVAEPEGVFVDSTARPEADGERWEIPVALKNNGTENMRITAIDVPSRYVFLSESEFTLAPGQSRTIMFRVDPAILTLEHGRSVTFAAHGKDEMRLTVPVGERPAH